MKYVKLQIELEKLGWGKTREQRNSDRLETLPDKKECPTVIVSTRQRKGCKITSYFAIAQVNQSKDPYIHCEVHISGRGSIIKNMCAYEKDFSDLETFDDYWEFQESLRVIEKLEMYAREPQ